MCKVSKRLAALLLSLLMIISMIPVTGLNVEAATKPKLAKKSVSIVIGGTSKIKVKNVPKGAKITYKSAQKNIATVSKQGKVKGIKSGTTKITVSVKKNSKTTKLTYKVTVKKPKLSKSKLSLTSGKTAKLSFKNKPTKAKYTWLSSNSQIATVSKSGIVTAKAKGNVTIKVKIKTFKNTYTLQCNVTVKTSNSNTDVKPTGITLDKNSASIEEGGTIIFIATVMPSNATNKTVIWGSSNTSVATVSNGKVTGISAGIATITAKTINGKKYICEIKVSPKSGQILDFDKFAQEGAELIKESGEPSGTNIAEDGEFASKRLIVRGKNTQLDFTQFNPKAVVKSNDGIYLIQFASVSATKTALSEISNWPDVDWVEPDTYSDVDAASNVSATSKSWGVSKIGADKYADSMSSIRDDIVVAVVDTGVSNHAFLSGRIQNGGFDYVDNDSDPSDKHYHGTHVAGTIADCTPGLNVKILPIRVLNAEGRGSSFNVGNGIKYAADHGAKVINLSLGGSHSNYKDENIEYAINKGVIVVVAAGNENDNTSYSCPAHLNKAIVVAAVDENDRRASFSNFGDSVDIAAPGVGIISCVPGGSYRSLNGTSMATPHVAAVAAMFKLKHPSMTPAQVETMVKENVRDLGSTGWDKYYGYGIPNLSNIADVEPTGVTLNQSNVSIKVGGTVMLTATVAPSNATDKTVTWSSSKTSVATVNNGKVTGVSAGTATITARTSNGKTATCNVNVIENTWSGYTKIYTSEDFNNIRNNLNGKYVLMNNIDLTSFSQWDPIGSNYNPFSGILDGNGYTVHGINIHGNITMYAGDNYYGGLFAKTNGATFKNISMEGNYNLVITPGDYRGTTVIAIGGIVGYSSNTKFESCENNIAINCDTKLRTSGKDADERVSTFAGGIAGLVYDGGSIESCINKGSILVKNYNGETSWACGGLIGTIHGGSVINCNNTGNVEAYSDSDHWAQVGSGGIAGESYDTNFIHCENYGGVKTTCVTYSDYNATYGCSAAAGGIVGIAKGDSSSDILSFFVNCINNSSNIQAIAPKSIRQGDIIGWEYD